ncbi:ABC transporter permease [Angustibacter luteus]|uniref:ABC transporter permease n=1 Tax=Angustibacter luteus TaxID=658456 RepID=A0ABW1JGY9_9ACTN
MSIDIAEAAGAPVPAHTESGRKRSRVTPVTLLLALAGGMVLMSLVRVITGANDIDSSGTVSATLVLAVPIAMAGLGGLWAERAGVVNIGLEGMMIFGTWGAGFGGYQWGPWAGLVCGVLFGALGGLLHAVATVTFTVDHIVSGVALNLLAAGLVKYLSGLAFVGKPGGGKTQSPYIDSPPSFTVPGVSDWLKDVEAKHWLFVSDLAGVVRGLTTNVSLFTILALALVIGTFFILWRTAFGLRLRSCGESPVAAESLGVNVYRYKYAAVIASGAFAGFGGVYLAEVAASIYRDGQTGGRGYIGLAAMIFGNWRPGGLLAGSTLFGYTDALQLRRGGESVHALLLLLALILLGIVVWRVLRRANVASTLVAAACAVGLFVWYATTTAVPDDFTGMTPYVATLLVLSLSAQRLRMPAADGLPYRRGEGG